VSANLAVGNLEQRVLEVGSADPVARAGGDAEEVLFVLEGTGTLSLAGSGHALAPESGAYIAPGEEYELRSDGPEPMRIVAVTIPDPAPAGDAAGRTVVRKLDEQESQDATGAREFRIVADPSTGLRSATHFVGYIPVGRAPDPIPT
jgi:glyoxylate utilization-related uncharacterized protein